MSQGQSTFEQLFNSVTEIKPSKGYWFVRTDSGQYFEEFYREGFIGMGWNYITVDDLKNMSVSAIKDKIASNEKLDMSIKKSKGKVTGIYNKIIRFQQLKKGDLVIIPSRGSSRFAFGIVNDSVIEVVNDPKGDCDYRKRRTVTWLEVKNVSALDPIFYKITASQHAISSVKKYQDYIDTETQSLYLKDGFGHFVFDIKSKDDINVDSLIEFIESVRRLLEQINIDFDFEENISQTTIKLNLQSPGKINFKTPVGKSLVILAAVLAISNGCTIDPHKVSTEAKKQIDTTMELHKDTVTAIHQSFRALDGDMEKINSIN